MPRLQCIVLDFDGTLTDVDAESEAYLTAYKRALGEKLGQDISRDWSVAQKYILDNADAHGWEFGGRIVAPAHADPYILAGCVARWLLDRRRALLDGKQRQTVLDELFKSLYGSLQPKFRAELPAFAEALGKTGLPVYVVTNSAPDAVKQKLDVAGFHAMREVMGGAKKFALEPPATPLQRFQSLPEVKRVADLERPVYLRRGRYLEALERVWAATGASPETTLVCGDIYEMDLAMPIALGAKVHLLARRGTRGWEKQAAAAGGGTVGPSLLGALANA